MGMKPTKVLWVVPALALFAVLVVLEDLANASAFRTGQESVTTAAVEVMGNATGRTSILIVNHDTANPIFCGGATASSTTGIRVAPGAALLIDGKDGGQYSAMAVVGCRSTGGTVTASFIEQYNP